MKHFLLAVVVCATVGIAAFGAQSPQQPTPTADPYLNNPAAGTASFPLAAPAGKDSNARAVAKHSKDWPTPTRSQRSLA
jgi:hypothetical protein